VSIVDDPNRRQVLGATLAVTAALLLAAAYLASPVFGLMSLFSAVRSGNAVQLRRDVDFPAVRGSLKTQLAATLAARPDGGAAGPPAAGRPALAAFLDKAVDRYVTPEAIAGLIDRSTRSPAAGPQPAGQDDGPGVAVTPHVAYRGFNRFEAGFSEKARPAESMNLVLARQGVFRWRLVGVELPPSGLHAIAEASPAEETPS
jgi:hypothetical protein